MMSPLAASLNSGAPPSRGQQWRNGVGPTLLVTLLVMSLQIVGAWGHIPLFWGDSGRWMYEVDRAAHGARLYRDVFWAFPPAGMWIMAGITRVIGTDVTQIWSVTAAIALAIASCYAVLVRRLLPHALAPWVAGTGMFLGMVYSQRDSAPLSLGMYTPAVPLAILALLVQLAMMASVWNRATLAHAAVIGAVGGVALLTKHDVWLSSLWLIAAVGAMPAPSAAIRLQRVFTALGGCAVVAGGGLTILTADPSTPPVRRIFSGFGHVNEYAGLNMPDLSLLVTELAVSGALCAFIAAAALTLRAGERKVLLRLLFAGLGAALAASAIWVGEAFIVSERLQRVGIEPLAPSFDARLWPAAGDSWHILRTSLDMLQADAWLHPIPLLLPLVVLGVVILKRTTVTDRDRWLLLFVLLVAALLLRARRMLSYPEWSAIMLDLPLFAMAYTLFSGHSLQLQRRLVWVVSGLMLTFALHTQWAIGYGLGSARGRFPATETPRGSVHLQPEVARLYETVRRATEHADPSLLRPVLSTGYSAGFAYLLGRHAPSSVSHGFRFSLFTSPDDAFRSVAREKRDLFLVEQPPNPDLVPVPDVTPWRWQPRVMLNAFERVDRSLFDRLKEGCAEIARVRGVEGAHGAHGVDGADALTVYDCAERGGAE